jgi:TolB-like protein
MRKFIFSAVFALLGAFAFSQQPVVAVAPFDVISGISTADANAITRAFFISLGTTNKVSLVNRTVVEQAIREHSFQAGDWSDKQKTAEIGKALNADWVVRGEFEESGSSILFTVQFYDLNTFRFVGGAYDRIANADEAYDKLGSFVNKLIQTIGDVNPPPPAVQTYKIGDTGPAGGIVFFDRGFITEDGWRYLEAAPAGVEFPAAWGAYGQNVPNTMTDIGFGKQNTKIIVDRLRALGETNKAAQLCAAFDINGYKDWFLPSKDELNLMYRNLKQKGLGGFSNDRYWSSSQGGSSTNYAWGQRFSDGGQDYIYYSKTNTYSVRAVRAF